MPLFPPSRPMDPRTLFNQQFPLTPPTMETSQQFPLTPYDRPPSIFRVPGTKINDTSPQTMSPQGPGVMSRVADWFGQPGVPDDGLLSDSGGGPNRLSVIGDALSGLAKGYISSIYGPMAQRGSAVAQGLLGAGDAVRQTRDDEYKRRRQEVIDRIEYLKATKGGGVKTNTLPPGAILTDETGRTIASNPMAEKPVKPEHLSDLETTIRAVSGGDPEKEAFLREKYFNHLTRDPAPAQFKMPEGKTVTTKDGRTLWVSPTGETRVIDTPPVETSGVKIPPTLLKQKVEDENALATAGGALEGLSKANQLNDLAGEGPATGVTKYFDYLTNPERYNATQELDSTIKRNVLGSLRATFGSMPTEGERQVLLDVEGSSNQPAAVRKEIFARAEQVYKEAIQRRKTRLNEINQGTYQVTHPGENLYDPAAIDAARISQPPLHVNVPGPTPDDQPQATPRVRTYNPATGKLE